MAKFLQKLLAVANTPLVGYIAFIFLFINPFVTLIIIGLNLAYVVMVYWTSYKFVNDRLTCVTGSGGTGKSPVITMWGLYRYKLAYTSYWISRYILRDKTQEKPLLYSNTPILIFKAKWYHKLFNLIFPLKMQFKDVWSAILTSDIILLKKRIPKHSVVIWFEIGSSLDNHEFDNVYLRDVRLFLRFFKHWVDGYFFCDEQSVDDIPSVVLRKIAKVYILFGFKKHEFVFPFNYLIGSLFRFGTTNAVNFVVGENMRFNSDGTVMERKAETIVLSFRRKYIDPFAYSEMYDSVPKDDPIFYSKFKTKVLMTFPYYSRKQYNGLSKKLRDEVVPPPPLDIDEV